MPFDSTSGGKQRPALPKSDEMPITLKAVYEVTPTPEATEYKVWTGRLVQGSSWTLLPIKGWDHSDGPHEFNGTWSDVPSDPLSMTMLVARSMCVTV